MKCTEEPHCIDNIIDDDVWAKREVRITDVYKDFIILLCEYGAERAFIGAHAFIVDALVSCRTKKEIEYFEAVSNLQEEARPYVDWTPNFERKPRYYNIWEYLYASARMLKQY